MATKIEWTEATWNPVTGCTPVSSGCGQCYAATMTKRLAAMGQEKYQGLIGNGHFNGVVKCHERALDIPLRRRKPTMYFVNSMSDLFHKGVPESFLDHAFAVMGTTRRHTFQVLTKRPDRAAEYFATDFDDYDDRIWDHLDKYEDEWPDWSVWFVRRSRGGLPIDMPPANVWLGTSCEDQKTADERTPHLLKCPAAVRFLSLEPLLGPIDLRGRLDGIHWVIVGGESGPNARPAGSGIDWFANIVDQCAAAGVPCFVKQLGSVWARRHYYKGKGGNPDKWSVEFPREYPSGRE